jgi:hypothetical protein
MPGLLHTAPAAPADVSAQRNSTSLGSSSLGDCGSLWRGQGNGMRASFGMMYDIQERLSQILLRRRVRFSLLPETLERNVGVRSFSHSFLADGVAATRSTLQKR